jgi:hypothetical protein
VIQEVVTTKGANAITSDHWHVVHSRFTSGDKRPFVRAVHSEHADGAECRAAAKELRGKLATESRGVPEAEQDEVFVRRPNFKSLKSSRSRKGKPDAPTAKKGK